MNTSGSGEGRVVLITGAGKGIGRAIALHMAGQGARVVVNNRPRDGADPATDVVAEIRAAGGQALANGNDVRSAGAAEAMVGAAIQAWGRLDAIVLNAGVSGPAKRFGAASLESFRDVLETNFFANLGLAQASLPHLTASGSGRILFVASSAGLYGVYGRAPYAVSKGALIALALSLAHELARDGIGVNVLAPYAATQMTADLIARAPRLAARLTPERVAPIAAWLVSAACQARGDIWITGGGLLRRARAMEGAVHRLPETGAEAWLSEQAPHWQDMTAPKGFIGGEAAFADFVASLEDEAAE